MSQLNYHPNRSSMSVRTGLDHEEEMRRKILDMESISCLKAGYSLEDLPIYLETLELRKSIQRARLRLQTSRTEEQEMEMRKKMVEKEVREMKEYLETVREVQHNTVQQLQSSRLAQ